MDSFGGCLFEKGGMIFLLFEGNGSSSDFLAGIQSLKDGGYNYLVDVTCVDHPSRERRFELVYVFLNLKSRKRVVVKYSLRDEEKAPSIVSIFPAAGWVEREVFDMYGVHFSNHGDLRRILSDYGFDGYPLRKDFPLSGYKEVRYDVEKGQVVKEDVKLVQEYRDFDFLMPWEGTQSLIEDKK